MMKELIAVVDETGGTSRPTENDDIGFGVGVILFMPEHVKQLSRVVTDISEEVKNFDFKYKHVKKSVRARRLFVDAINSDGIQVYGFYSVANGIAREIIRGKVASNYYENSVEDDSELIQRSTDDFLKQYVGYMVPSLMRHAHVNRYKVDVFWDRRTDHAFIRDTCNHFIHQFEGIPGFSGYDNLVSYRGIAVGDNAKIAKLAGVLAGDLKQYFGSHGPRIWKHLDPEGLKYVHDSQILITPVLDEENASRRVATINEHLADNEPFERSDTVMLQAYYKKFLGHDKTNCRLISFCSPDGQMGILEVEHGRRWHIRQLAD